MQIKVIIAKKARTCWQSMNGAQLRRSAGVELSCGSVELPCEIGDNVGPAVGEGGLEFSCFVGDDVGTGAGADCTGGGSGLPCCVGDGVGPGAGEGLLGDDSIGGLRSE